MLRRSSRLRSGMTTMEVMVALGFAAVLGIAVVALFSTTMNQWSRGSSKSMADDYASLVLQTLVRGIEDGQSAAVVGGGLEVRLPGVNDQGDYTRSVDGDLIRLYTSNGSLYRKVNSGTANTITTGVGSFAFTVAGGTITLGLTLSRQSGTYTSQSSFTQRVALRNYSSS
jgi:hypothetical protein